MRERWELASPAARSRGDAGNRRLHARWDILRARRKRHVVANVAIARELAGWCWSLAVLEESPPRLLRRPRTVAAARGATRETAMSNVERSARRSTLDTLRSSRTSPSCGNQPAHISLTARRKTRSATARKTTKHEAPAPSDGDGRLTLPLDRKVLHISCTRRTGS